MKKILRNINTAKETLSSIPIGLDASIYTESSSQSFNKMFLNYDGIFKMIRIYYKGRVTQIVDSKYNSLYIKYNTTTISVININSISLDNDGFLFAYVGEMDKISKVVVYPYGAKQINASFTTNSEKEKMSKNQNVFDTSDLKFIDLEMVSKSYSAPSDTNEDIVKFVTRRNTKQIGTNQTVNGLYTNGTKFMLGKMKYIGHYNFNPNNNKYMTGKTDTIKSKEIKIISDINRTREV